MVSSPAHAGDPVRLGFSGQSSASLEYWVARSSRAMTAVGERRTIAFSRRITPEVLQIISPSSNSEGAGNAGCALHPRSREQVCTKSAPTSIQGSGEHPTSPAQWLYGL